MQLNKQTRWQLKIQKVIFLLLFVSILGLLAWLSNHYSTQFDVTDNHRFSLSQRSIDLLKLMPGKISLHAYISDNTTRLAVKEIIQQYQQYKASFKLKFFNPDIDIEQAKADQVHLKNNIAFIIHYKNRQQAIYSLSENTISNALLRLSSKAQHRIIFLSGHNERNPFDKGNRGYSKLTGALKKQGFNVDTLNLLLHPIPSRTRLLIIATPEKPLHKAEVAQIKNYLNKGGNLFWLTDTGNLSGLEPIAKKLGIHFLPGMIVDNNTNLRNMLAIQSPAIIPVIKYPAHEITRQLNYTLFPLTRGIAINTDTANRSWKITALIQSLPNSWLETSPLSEDIVFQSKQGDIAGPINIGMALQRPRPEQASTTAHPADSSSPLQRVFVIGDSDFLANSYIGAGDNLTLGLNIINWLNSNDRLLHIAAKKTGDLKLVITDTQRALFGFGFLIALPLILLVSGFTLWYRRNKR